MSKVSYEEMMEIICESIDKEKLGELMSMDKIYTKYGRPRYYSPKRILQYGSVKGFVEYSITQNNMEVDKVIQYHDGDVFGNFHVVMLYLGYLDVKNKYKLMRNGFYAKIWDML